MLVVSAFVIAFRISASENQGQTTPRVHLRYICYLFIPYVIMMLDTFEHTHQFDKKKLFIITICLSGWYMLVALESFNTIVPNEDFVDHTMLQFMSQNMNDQLLILIIYLCIVFAIVVLLLKKPKMALIAISCSLLGLNLWNDVLTVTRRRTISSCESEITSIEWLEDFVKTHSKDNILVLSDGGKMSLLFATYADENNVFTLDYDSYYAYFENTSPDQVNWTAVQQNVHIPRFNLNYSNLTDVDYIVLVDSINTTLDGPDGTLVDSPITDTKIYSLVYPEKVPNLTFHTKVIHAN